MLRLLPALKEANTPCPWGFSADVGDMRASFEPFGESSRRLESPFSWGFLGILLLALELLLPTCSGREGKGCPLWRETRAGRGAGLQERRAKGTLLGVWGGGSGLGGPGGASSG